MPKANPAAGPFQCSEIKLAAVLLVFGYEIEAVDRDSESGRVLFIFSPAAAKLAGRHIAGKLKAPTRVTFDKYEEIRTFVRRGGATPKPVGWIDPPKTSMPVAAAGR